MPCNLGGNKLSSVAARSMQSSFACLCFPSRQQGQQVSPFPLKLQVINVSQHLQEIKARSPASCRWGRRLGYQTSNINTGAVRGADAGGGLYKQNYNHADYRRHLWDSPDDSTSGPTARGCLGSTGPLSSPRGGPGLCTQQQRLLCSPWCPAPAFCGNA